VTPVNAIIGQAEMDDREPRAKQAVVSWLRGRSRPLRVLLVVAIAAFAAELAVMILLFSVVPTHPGLAEAVLDATLLVLLLFPVLYLSVVRPMARSIVESERVRSELRAARDELEVRIKDRTAALEAANHDLHTEVGMRRRAETELQRAFEEQRRFLADASHELRTPLTIIRGEAEVALRAPEQRVSEYRESLETIVGLAEHMARVVDDLLFLARSTVGQIEYQMAALELGGLLEAVYHQSRSLAERQRVHLRLAREGPAVVWADAQRLSQLFMILVDNAIKYTPAGGEIRLSLSKAGGMAQVSVADTGMGIPPEELALVFERFYRGQSQRRSSPGGVGLGLAIAKAIAEGHQGTISVVSEPGTGTTFTVSLPLHE
jgi:signal transduction histidine kinase